MRRQSSALAAVAVALTLTVLGGCSTSAPADDRTIRVLVPNVPGDHKGQALFAQIVDKFHESFPDYRVQPDFAPYSALNQKISTALISNRNYDVISAGIGWVQPLADVGALQSLRGEGIDRQTLAADVPAAFVDPMIYRDEVYALPLAANPRLIAYSRGAFAEAGLDPTRPPRTLAELREYAKRLTITEGGKMRRAGFDFWAEPSNYRQQFVAFMAAMGGRMFAGEQPTFTEPAGVRALELMRDMITVDRSSVYGYRGAAQTSLVTSGEAAMGFTGPYVDCSPAGIGKKCDDLVFFNLRDAREAMYVGGRVVGIGKGTRHRAAALAMVKAFTDIKVQEAISKLDDGVPVSKAAASSEFVRSNPASSFALANLDKGVFEYGGATFLDFRAEFGPSLDQVLLGRAPAQPTLDALAAIARG